MDLSPARATAPSVSKVYRTKEPNIDTLPNGMTPEIVDMYMKMSALGSRGVLSSGRVGPLFCGSLGATLHSCPAENPHVPSSTFHKVVGSNYVRHTFSFQETAVM